MSVKTIWGNVWKEIKPSLWQAIVLPALGALVGVLVTFLVQSMLPHQSTAKQDITVQNGGTVIIQQATKTPPKK